jgi:hypothetical protein
MVMVSSMPIVRNSKHKTKSERPAIGGTVVVARFAARIRCNTQKESEKLPILGGPFWAKEC